MAPSQIFAAPSTFPTDLVELHESIATLLAAQGEWERAYSHLRAAFKLARDHDCGALRIPEQYRREVDALREAHAQALEASLRDSLTASYNRRYLDQKLVALLAEQCSTGEGVAVALIDLDPFKQVNDTYGHLLGDRVLQRVVALLQVDLPEGAFCARYGGEEFVLVIPDVDARAAVTAVERARARIADHGWTKLAPALRVTISVGLVHHAAHDRTPATHADAERHLRRADDLLYFAKRAGRNAVAYRTHGAIRIAGLDDNCR
ncbi:MAG: GGDEF domain-containing protein [Haloechinothrix sp.]